MFNLSCLRSYYSLNGPQCLSHLFKLIDCINCNFYYEIVRNKWFIKLFIKHRVMFPWSGTPRCKPYEPQPSPAAATLSGKSSEIICLRSFIVRTVRTFNKAFRHVEILFVQGNIFVLNQNKPPCLVIKKEDYVIKKRG